MFGEAIVNVGKVVRPSQLIRSVGPTKRGGDEACSLVGGPA
jgi:hypothetical protein